MTYDEQIAVLQAAKEGKKIDIRWPQGWEPTTAKRFNFRDYEFRVSPEPREWWIASGLAYERPLGSFCVHVREVLP